MSTSDVVNTALGGVVAVKVLETGMNIINQKKPRKLRLKKLKKIKY